MKYNVQQDHTKDPTMQEMTEVALRVLSRNPRGFYLFVEGEWQPLGEQRCDEGHQGGFGILYVTYLQEAALTTVTMMTKLIWH